MTALRTPNSTGELAKRLKLLHSRRKRLRHPRRRLSLTRKQRGIVLAKTAGRCHLCGGKTKGKFAADHVLSHAAGGRHAIDNYLPAHRLCNGCRWFYSAEEFQWILRMGVWARKQMEDGKSDTAENLREAFLKHERGVRKRRKPRL